MIVRLSNNALNLTSGAGWNGRRSQVNAVFGEHQEQRDRPVMSVLALLLIVVQEQAAAGGVCVAPLPPDARRTDHDMRDAEPQKREPRYEFSVSIDGREAVPIEAGARPRLIENLALRRRHKVVVRDGREVIESFWFTFESRGSRRLCLSYGPWYQTWQLEPPRARAAWCQCGESQ